MYCCWCRSHIEVVPPSAQSWMFPECVLRASLTIAAQWHPQKKHLQIFLLAFQNSPALSWLSFLYHWIWVKVKKKNSNCCYCVFVVDLILKIKSILSFLYKISAIITVDVPNAFSFTTKLIINFIFSDVSVYYSILQNWYLKCQVTFHYILGETIILV